MKFCSSGGHWSIQGHTELASRSLALMAQVRPTRAAFTNYTHRQQPHTTADNPPPSVVSSARLLCAWLRFPGRHGSLDISVDRRKGHLDTTGPPCYHEIQSATSDPTHSCRPQRVWDGPVANSVPKYVLLRHEHHHTAR